MQAKTVIAAIALMGSLAVSWDSRNLARSAGRAHVLLTGAYPVGSAVESTAADRDGGVCQMKLRLSNVGAVKTDIVGGDIVASALGETASVPFVGRAFLLHKMMLRPDVWRGTPPDPYAQIEGRSRSNDSGSVELASHSTEDLIVSLSADFTSDEYALRALTLEYNYSGGPIAPPAATPNLNAQVELRLSDRRIVRSEPMVCLWLTRRQ